MSKWHNYYHYYNYYKITLFVLSYAQMAEARCSKGAKKRLQIEVTLSVMRFNDVYEIKNITISDYA